MKTLIERLQDPELYVDAIDEAVAYIRKLEADNARLRMALKTVTHELTMQLAMHHNCNLKQAEQNPIVIYAHSILEAPAQ